MGDENNNQPPANPPANDPTPPPANPPGGDGGPKPPVQDAPPEPTPEQKRITALEDEIKTLKEGTPPGSNNAPPQQPPAQDPPPQQPPVNTDGPIDAKMYAVLLNQGYNQNELSFIESAAKLEPDKPLKEVIDGDFVKNGIASMRSQDESQQAPSTPTGRVPHTPEGVPFGEVAKGDRSKNFSFDAWKKRQK